MTVREIDLGEYAGFLPGLAVTAGVTLAAAGRVARRLGVRPGLAVMLLLALGVIVSATLTPSREAVHGAIAGQPVGGPGTCDLQRIRPALPVEFDADVALNILLFVPLGFVLPFLPRKRWSLGIVAGAVVLPALIETVQLFVPQLDRTCQSADVADNLTGLVLGVVAGTLAVGVMRIGGRTSAQG
jgi:hypothetical protein